MTLDLGWQSMQSKIWAGVLSFAGLALVAFAQDEGTEAATNKTDITQVTSGSGGAATANEDDKSTGHAALEGIADAAKERDDGVPPEGADVTTLAAASSATVDDNYTPTERISEDRSVSFPVDI